MFNKRKNEQITDERIINEHRRFNSEAFTIIIWALMIDVFYRSVILRQDISQYWDIAIIFFGTCFFIAFRKVSAGVFAYEGMKKAWRNIIISSLIAGITMTATFIWAGAERNFVDLAVNFLIGTITFGITMSLFYYISNKRSNG